MFDTGSDVPEPGEGTRQLDDDRSSIGEEFRRLAKVWASSQMRLVRLAAEFADGTEWVNAGVSSAAHWLADAAQVERSTTREWIRIGRRLRELPATADAFADGSLSYSKVRALTRIATPDNEVELVSIAEVTPANDLAAKLAGWMTDNWSAEAVEEHQQRRRSITWRVEPDGMTLATLRLPPLLAATFIGAISSIVRRPGRRERGADWPTLPQQRADALGVLLDEGGGTSATEVVLHVRGDGATLDDGTPIAGSVVERIAPTSFIRALIHDAESRPINASSRRRHPSERQKRVVKERDRACVDCGSSELLHFDHVPDYDISRRTIVDELQIRCAPCHDRRHGGGTGTSRDHPAA